MYDSWPSPIASRNRSASDSALRSSMGFEFEFEVEEEGEEGDAEWLDAAATAALWLEIALALVSALLVVAAALDAVAGSLGGGTLHLRPVDAAAARVANVTRAVSVRRMFA